MTPKGKKGKNDLLIELETELRHLRGAVREVAENFALRREAEIEAAISRLPALPAVHVRARVPELLKAIRGFRPKPAKGRVRDLREVAAVVDRLVEEITESSATGGTR